MRAPIRTISVCLITAVAVAGMYIGVRAATAPDTSILGSYKVLVRGDFTGDGNAAVGAKSVTITAQVKDAAGNQVQFLAANLKMENGRFNGTGRVGGADVRVSGRVDPPGDLLKSARLTATFTGATDVVGRVMGERRGN